MKVRYAMANNIPLWDTQDNFVVDITMGGEFVHCYSSITNQYILRCHCSFYYHYTQTIARGTRRSRSKFDISRYRTVNESLRWLLWMWNGYGELWHRWNMAIDWYLAWSNLHSRCIWGNGRCCQRGLSFSNYFSTWVGINIHSQFQASGLIELIVCELIRFKKYLFLEKTENDFSQSGNESLCFIVLSSGSDHNGWCCHCQKFILPLSKIIVPIQIKYDLNMGSDDNLDGVTVAKGVYKVDMTALVI